MRLIDGDALMSAVMAQDVVDKSVAKRLIIQAQTVEVVQCKDCKYCEYPESERDWCKKGHLHGNAETWYCADGERREE